MVKNLAQTGGSRGIREKNGLEMTEGEGWEQWKI